MRRPLVILVLAAGAVMFVAASLVLAGQLSASSAERAAVADLAKAEAAGDETAALAALDGCRPRAACRARVRSILAAVRGPGRVLILQYEGGIGLGLGDRDGIGRLAWKRTGALPVVQCVLVRRSGVVRARTSIVRVSEPIGREDDCPGAGGLS